MKITSLFVLGLALCMVVPGEGQRTRLRGKRRFALASPAIPIQDDDGIISDAEDREESVAREIAPVRSRTPQLRRRMNASLRLRNKEPTQTSSGVVAPTATAAPRTPSSGGRRGGIKIRRPTRRRTTTVATTTTTTTTTPNPEIEEITDEESKMAVVPELLATSTSKPIIVTTTKQPRKKFRPIPIKLGRGRQSSTANRKSSVSATPKPVEKELDVHPQRDTNGEHRFSPQTRSPLRSRGRPRVSAVKATVIEETPAQVKLEERVDPTRTRSRTRVPSTLRRRRPLRIRAKPAPVEELTPEEEELIIAAEELPIAVPEAEAVIRLLSLDELKMLSTNLHAEKELRIKTTTTKPIVKRKKDTLTAKKKVVSHPIKKTSDDEAELQLPPSRRVFEVSNVNLGFRRGGDRYETLIGTVEDTPAHEVRAILAGFGSRRRGFGIARAPTQVVKETKAELEYDYDFYDYLYEK